MRINSLSFYIIRIFFISTNIFMNNYNSRALIISFLNISCLNWEFFKKLEIKLLFWNQFKMVQLEILPEEDEEFMNLLEASPVLKSLKRIINRLCTFIEVFSKFKLI